MRKVTRTECPKSLQDNAATWTKELLDEISKQNNNYAKVDKTFINRYNKSDVKEALSKMYTNHCCYCESLLGIQTYGRIEHLKPKSNKNFYHLTFDWNNLHWCCEVCNTSYKKTNWNYKKPILDPSKDEISDYLRLNLTTGEYIAINNNPRAETTKLHTGLNREQLVKARQKLILDIVKRYKSYEDSSKAEEFLKDIISLKEDFDYPSLKDTVVAYLHTYRSRRK